MNGVADGVEVAVTVAFGVPDWGSNSFSNLSDAPAHCVCVTVTAATYRTLALKLNCEVNHSHLTVMRISPAECLVN